MITATYRLRCVAADATHLAKQIALEQTVEVPEELLDDSRIREEVAGQVRSVVADLEAPETFLAVIEYSAELAGNHVGQMWNLLYGNVSLKRRVRLERVDLPPSSLARFRGPRFGVEGLRSRLGVTGRPLLATALKPRGSTMEHLAQLAAQFARGGGDVVKDDHNLVDPSFEAFQQRVRSIADAIRRAEDKTGRTTLYLPNLSAPSRELDRYADFLLKSGIGGALIAPMLLGLDTTRDLTSRYPLFFLAHPTFTGSFFHDPDHGVSPAVLLGQWFRLIGCDGTIFPNLGGRFTFSGTECQQIANAALSDMGEVRRCWPSPAGGMSFEKLPEMARMYGEDSLFLIGGALLLDSSNLAESTARFARRIEELFPHHRATAPQPADVISACERPFQLTENAAVLEHLAFQAGFSWDGRSREAYKLNGALPFAGVSRTELIGRFGEQTAFDVRYFEIASGGYSSLEQHLHTHVVIGVRGEGVLRSGDNDQTVKPFDVAYVPPERVHQLHNRGSEPFGFFCIVDHVRDKPRAP